jgi:group I intron endonuclease
MPFYVYKVTNRINPKIYVGCTTRTLEVRWKAHISNGRNLSLYQTPTFNHAMHDLGIENFSISLLEECPDKETMHERELYWIRELSSMEPNGYNMIGRKLSDEQIILILTNQYEMTQKQYAQLFGVSVSTIAAVQSGRIAKRFFFSFRIGLKNA